MYDIKLLLLCSDILPSHHVSPNNLCCPRGGGTALITQQTIVRINKTKNWVTNLWNNYMPHYTHLLEMLQKQWCKIVRLILMFVAVWRS